MKRRIEVKYLTRVEGEGALTLETQGGEVTNARLEIFEPPRFFEALLVGRDYRQAPDITSRICGICPVAYQITASQAMEHALGLSVAPEIQLLKRLVYCGEWIESHILHIFLLHLPDFLGLDDSLQLAKKNPQAVQTALNIKKLGNELVTLVGGREIHPINLRVGGFYQAPSCQALRALLPRFQQALQDLRGLLPLLAGLDFPTFTQDYLFVALRPTEGYPLEQGRVVTSTGLDLGKEDYETRFQETQVPGSNALHSHLEGEPYLVGPMARFALNFDRLTPACQQIARDLGLGPGPERNPFKSILVRAVESYYALEEAARSSENISNISHNLKIVSEKIDEDFKQFKTE